MPPDKELHRDIPKDENGDPIFLILPDGVRASYERKLRSAKAAWLATGDVGALRQAAVFIRTHRQPGPDWFFDALVMLTTNLRSDRDVQRAGTTGGTHCATRWCATRRPTLSPLPALR